MHAAGEASLRHSFTLSSGNNLCAFTPFKPFVVSITAWKFLPPANMHSAMFGRARRSGSSWRQVCMRPLDQSKIESRQSDYEIEMIPSSVWLHSLPNDYRWCWIRVDWANNRDHLFRISTRHVFTGYEYISRILHTWMTSVIVVFSKKQLNFAVKESIWIMSSQHPIGCIVLTL